LRSIVGALLLLVPPLIAWKTARLVHGEAWIATKAHVE
jgi:hypothetical protein